MEINYGFVRIAAAVPELKVSDVLFNTEKIIELIHVAEENRTQVVCFPELCITGYTCADLFFQQQLQEEVLKALSEIQMATLSVSCAVIVGAPLRFRNRLFNTAVVLQKGRIIGIVPKTFLPNHGEFYEKRWFVSGKNFHGQTIVCNEQEVPFGVDLIFFSPSFSFGIEICEDLWAPLPPSTELCMAGAEIIFNPSASNELIGKHEYRLQLIEQQSARCHAGYVYSSSGMYESTTDLVFSGSAVIAENGKILETSKRFSLDSQLIFNEIDVDILRYERMHNSNFGEDALQQTYRKIEMQGQPLEQKEIKRTVSPYPFVPPVSKREESCSEIFSIQTSGLAKRWLHTQAKSLIVGISGGLDSTLALLVCVKTADKLGFDRKTVIGVTMPGFGTTNRTYGNALNLMKSLEITGLEISIKEACLQHFKDIGHDPDVHDVIFENTQARERTQILMDLANKYNGLVIGTGDLSELALGWATYNGDHMSMYAVNSGIPKTLVRYLVEYVAQSMEEKTKTILEDILKTPVSPELLPADEYGEIHQKTEDLVGPYELHDFFLYYFVRFGFSPKKILFLAQKAFGDKYSEAILRKWLKVFLRRFYSQQFKRSCMPDGPKVGSINLSPRGDWRMPSDAGFHWDDII
ncbi:MAG: Glutamine-dependent NAD(+) synthetase [Bacteroidetes bacterium ADurb.BinA395]|nr:MAG: Glutamine-dependent NAD(+) synthetase [Bacteroidetes bacterium ADurb.BinA395]